MQRIIEKAGVLIEALPYIQRFHNAVVVVKFGGSAMEDRAQADSILLDIAFMECVGICPVIVHGGGKSISRKMKAAGIESKFVKGLRVTCEKSIEVVEQVMKQEINPGIVASLMRMGAKAEGLHGDSVFEVTRMKDVDPDTGEALDWGFVGDPHKVHIKAVRALLKKHIIPVITPLGLGKDGKLHNINADVAAAALAGALKARKLVFLSDVPGLLRNPKDEASLIPTLDSGDVEGLVKEGVIDGGMLPKVKSGIEALHAGVKKVHMIDGRMPHSLLLEVFTDKGVGTEIVENDQK
ncbi:MAG: acetylglutamate kinase [bacterium]